MRHAGGLITYKSFLQVCRVFADGENRALRKNSQARSSFSSPGTAQRRNERDGVIRQHCFSKDARRRHFDPLTDRIFQRFTLTDAKLLGFSVDGSL